MFRTPGCQLLLERLTFTKGLEKLNVRGMVPLMRACLIKGWMSGTLRKTRSGAAQLLDPGYASGSGFRG